MNLRNNPFASPNGTFSAKTFDNLSQKFSLQTVISGQNHFKLFLMFDFSASQESNNRGRSVPRKTKNKLIFSSDENNFLLSATGFPPFCFDSFFLPLRIDE